MVRGGGGGSRRNAGLLPRPAIGFLASLGLLFGMAACDGNGGQEPTEPTTPETSESQTTDATEDATGEQDYPHPEPHEDIENDGQAGAEAAAVYFVKLFPYSLATGDLEAWDQISAESCEHCDLIRGNITEIYDAGGYATIDPYEILGVSSTPSSDVDGDWLVYVEAVAAEARIFDEDGAEMESCSSGRSKSTVLLRHNDNSWQVVEAHSEDLE